MDWCAFLKKIRNTSNILLASERESCVTDCFTGGEIFRDLSWSAPIPCFPMLLFAGCLLRLNSGSNISGPPKTSLIFLSISSILRFFTGSNILKSFMLVTSSKLVSYGIRSRIVSYLNFWDIKTSGEVHFLCIVSGILVNEFFSLLVIILEKFHHWVLKLISVVKSRLRTFCTLVVTSHFFWTISHA